MIEFLAGVIIFYLLFWVVAIIIGIPMVMWEDHEHEKNKTTEDLQEET